MLVLTRKAGQEIRVGENVVLTVVGIQGNRVQIGVAAPGEVSIRRAELPPRTAAPLAAIGRERELRPAS